MDIKFKHIFQYNEIIIIIYSAANDNAAWDMLKNRIEKSKELGVLLPSFDRFKLVSEESVKELIS